MKRLLKNRRTLTLIAVLVPLVALFIYVANRSGPLSPVPVTVISVESRSIKPSLFGIGTVEARYTYQIGPTVSGRVLQVNVHVGDRVVAGQVLGEMDPVDLDSRILAQDAAIKRAESLVLAAEADIHDATDRYAFAQTQLKRFEPLLSTHAVSEDSVDIKRLEYQLAETRLLAVHA
ncbi:MAG: biotin/lipoyl-binding protein, partial [Desulfatirhabdiaceae bacterium]